MFTFQFVVDKIDQNNNFAKLPSAKWLFWYNCKFNHSKMKKKNSSSQFSLVTGFFEGTKEIFYTYSGLREIHCLVWENSKSIL